MCDYFVQHFIDTINFCKVSDERNVIRNIFRISLFCITLLAFFFFGSIVSSMALNNM